MTKGVQDRMVEVARVRDSFYPTSLPDAAVALTAADCVLVNLPSGSGATGRDALRRYLADDVLPHLRPAADLSRTRH
jgi:hypothetical protein